MKKLYTVSKNKTGSYCDSDNELLIAKFRLKLKKVDKTTRPVSYDQNQILYDYTVEVQVKSLSHVQLFVILWTITYQAPLTMGFSRQEYWSGYLVPSPGDLPNPGIKPRSPSLQVDFIPAEPTGKLYVVSVNKTGS